MNIGNYFPQYTMFNEKARCNNFFIWFIALSIYSSKLGGLKRLSNLSPLPLLEEGVAGGLPAGGKSVK